MAKKRIDRSRMKTVKIRAADPASTPAAGEADRSAEKTDTSPIYQPSDAAKLEGEGEPPAKE